MSLFIYLLIYLLYLFNLLFIYLIFINLFIHLSRGSCDLMDPVTWRLRDPRMGLLVSEGLLGTLPSYGYTFVHPSIHTFNFIHSL